MTDIRTVLNSLDEQDKRLWTQHRTEIRRSYITAHNSILGVTAWSPDDDVFLDYVDIKLALLFDKSGGIHQNLDSPVVATKEDATKIETKIDEQVPRSWKATLDGFGK